FTPTMVDLWRGKTPRAFTPGFSLSFALASLGFVAWMIQSALSVAPNSMDRTWSLIYAAQNVVLFAVSFTSYIYSRRDDDATTKVARAIIPVVPGEIYGVILGTFIGL